jgi:hypothetical protein
VPLRRHGDKPICHWLTEWGVDISWRQELISGRFDPGSIGHSWSSPAVADIHCQELVVDNHYILAVIKQSVCEAGLEYLVLRVEETSETNKGN